MKKGIKYLSLVFFLGLFFQGKSVQAEALTTKVIGNKNYGIYASLGKVPVKYQVKRKVYSKKKKRYVIKKVTKTKLVWKFGKKLANSREFKLAHVQSQSYKVYQGKRYYFVYVDGRAIGYVNEKAFARNKAEVVNEVSLVNNPNDTTGFDVRDAVNYITDSHGSVVDKYQVKTNVDRISEKTPGIYWVTFKYGKAHAKVKVTVRRNPKEGLSKADKKPGKGGNFAKTWFPQQLANRGNFNAQVFPHTYWGSDKTGKKKAAKLTTKFYEPNSFSLLAGSVETNVRTNVQGLDVYGQDMVTTNFYGVGQAAQEGANGRVILYHLNSVPTYALQYIPTNTLNLATWKYYVKNIRISPWIKLGHGQSVGSTGRYIYELANWNRAKKPMSNELLQIDKKTMLVKKIWTFKVANGALKYNRYFLNADVTDDNTILALFHNKSKGRYEFWQIKRSGNTFTAKEAAAVDGDLISNSSQVQGFTYNVAHKYYYIAFNDFLFKISAKGNLVNYYRFHANREVEGLASYKSKIYVAMNHRAEVLDSTAFR
ncbi:hypothetical protein [Lactobacillus sp.]|uniref:hypothetical protein n=1 Tax=Lactobacillus sp. TaxID=1591 RepID=UPI003EFAFBC7